MDAKWQVALAVFTSYQTQCKVFDILGLSKELMHVQFAHFLEALSYGCPPHLGIAFGFDRLMMLMTHTQSIRDVIPFPKTTHAQDLMIKAPDAVEKERLKRITLVIRC